MSHERPKIGEECLLYNGGDKSFNGFYIGSFPVKTQWYIEAPNPEGDIFTRKNGEEIEIYPTREEFLTERWFSDGDDGPYWPAGIKVEKIDVELSDLEKVYLEGRLKVYEELNVMKEVA